MTLPYPKWVKKSALEMYKQELSCYEISELIGLPVTTIWRWCKQEGIGRTKSEAGVLRQPPSQETIQKRVLKMKGKKHPMWKGDDIGYRVQHHRAQKDFPILGICQMPDCENTAIDRARIDHNNLPYRKSYILPMCRSHNEKHSFNNFVILFQEVET